MRLFVLVKGIAMAATSSAMVPYSIGIVAINKKLDSDEIEAAPIEDLIYLSGASRDNMG